mmetsp:Transcript_2902/g.8772  ORF Transcript_2902/g.8772 Transcript_2902/m.8772 type:complete len:593 (+) Transcript_2902:111-1889(+)
MVEAAGSPPPLAPPPTVTSTRRPRRGGKASGAVDVTEQAPQSRFKGVYYVLGGRWESKITFQSKTRHIGTFDTEIEAAFAFDAKAHQLGVPHRANFIYDAEGNVVSTQVVESLRGMKRGRHTSKVKAAAAIADLEEAPLTEEQRHQEQQQLTRELTNDLAQLAARRRNGDPGLATQQNAHLRHHQQQQQEARYQQEMGYYPQEARWGWGPGAAHHAAAMHHAQQQAARGGYYAAGAVADEGWDYPDYPPGPVVMMVQPSPPGPKRRRRSPTAVVESYAPPPRQKWGAMPVLWDAVDDPRAPPPHARQQQMAAAVAAQQQQRPAMYPWGPRAGAALPVAGYYDPSEDGRAPGPYGPPQALSAEDAMYGGGPMAAQMPYPGHPYRGQPQQLNYHHGIMDGMMPVGGDMEGFAPASSMDDAEAAAAAALSSSKRPAANKAHKNTTKEGGYRPRGRPSNASQQQVVQVPQEPAQPPPPLPKNVVEEPPAAPDADEDVDEDASDDHPPISARSGVQYSGPEYYDAYRAPAEAKKAVNAIGHVSDLLAAATSALRTTKVLERPASCEEDDDDSDAAAQAASNSDAAAQATAGEAPSSS